MAQIFWLWRCINILTAIFIKGKSAFSNGPRSLPRNAHKCIILHSWVVGNFTLADNLFAKLLQSLKTWLSVNNNLSAKLFLSIESPTTFD